MNTHDLETLLRGEAHFKGVFMRDEPLPKTGAFILNLGKLTSDGTHWVSVYKRSYYDPFGLPAPRELQGRIRTYNRVQHQHLKSSLCGYFAAAFIHLRNCGYSDYDINYRIFTRDAVKNFKTLGRISAEHFLCEMSKTNGDARR